MLGCLAGRRAQRQEKVRAPGRVRPADAGEACGPGGLRAVRRLNDARGPGLKDGRM
jgi:hypothetical protein